jgi:hypothetical protein
MDKVVDDEPDVDIRLFPNLIVRKTPEKHGRNHLVILFDLINELAKCIPAY